MVTIPRDPLNGFGLRYKGNTITFLRAGHPSELRSQIEIGDEILFINGRYVEEDIETSEVTSLIGKSQKSVTIIFQRGTII